MQLTKIDQGNMLPLTFELHVKTKQKRHIFQQVRVDKWFIRGFHVLCE